MTDSPRIKTRKGELSEEEAYLVAILLDRSGIDIAEFLWADRGNEDECYRVYPSQWMWWRDKSDRQVNQCSRSVGKSESINVSAHAFPFSYPGEEMVIVGPERPHIDAIADRIEARLLGSKLMQEMLVKGRTGITHRPFKVLFSNDSRIISRLPQRDGKGLKGIHPVILEVDECFPAGTLVTTRRGQVPVEDVCVGDEVLTHMNRWRCVTDTFQRERDTVRIEMTGHPGMVASENHPFWAMERTDAYQLQMNDEGEMRKTHSKRFSDPDWIAAKDLEGCYVSTPTNFPKGHVPSFLSTGQRGTNAKLPCDENAEGFMWLAGLWVAEGCTSHDQVIWTVHVDEVDEIVERMKAVGLAPEVYETTSDQCRNINVGDAMLVEWLPKHFGKGSHNKTVPSWALGLPESKRQELFDGIIFGDGCYVGNNWELTTVSKKLGVSFKMLAASLGFAPRFYWTDTSQRYTEIQGKQVHSKGFYQIVANKNKQTLSYNYNEKLYQPIRNVTSTNKKETLYDITVEEDHSFTADGITVKNSQDLTEMAWRELPEVVRWEIPGARWRIHGVSKGLRDSFYSKTQPGSGFTVHRITAMSRPRWTPADRAQRVKEYGSDYSPDFKRNVYGLHGDAMNRIFLQHVLMQGQVRRDDNPEHSLHNEYHFRSVVAIDVQQRTGEHISLASENHVEAISDILQLPDEHLKDYKTFWVGIDLGLVADPSEILVFAEYVVGDAEAKTDRRRKIAVPKDGETRLKLVARFTVREIPAPLQADLISMIVDHYEPVAVGLDANGNGMPIFQELQKRAGKSRFELVEADDLVAAKALTTIRNYNFGAKLYAGIDEKLVEELGLVEPAEVLAKAGIKRWTKDWATDVLRDEWVNKGRLMFPDDDEILNDFNGQTWQSSKDPVDAYGNRRRVYGGSGGFHVLDAARFAALAWRQGKIEAFAATKPAQAPVVISSF